MEEHRNHQHHESMDGLVSLLSKANRDLTLVHNQLDKEFQHSYPDAANPMKLLSRIKNIQEDLPLLKQQCQDLLTAKQELIDQASATLVGNRATVKRMQASLGIESASDAEDVSYSNFKEIVDEWAAQVRSKPGGGTLNSEPEDINQMLFSAIVHNN